METAAGTAASAAAAGGSALPLVGVITSLITSLGGLALSIWGGKGSGQVWTADMFKGVADNGKYTADEATLFGIGASIIIVIIMVVLLFIAKKK